MSNRAAPGIDATKPDSSSSDGLCPLKVFVRVRPFMQRELATGGNDRCIIEMKDYQSPVITTSYITDTETKRESYTFEKCFNGAMRGGKAIEDGSVVSMIAARTDQSAVYAHVGLPVLRNVLDGYNGCVLAYGQTGSGKTFTMMGPPAVLGSGGVTGRAGRKGKEDDFTNDIKKPLEGIVPRLVRDLFRELHKKRIDDDTLSFKIELEYLEIYKEKVMDLLSPTSEDSLRVRQHNEKGPYVEGITRKQVGSAEEVFQFLRQGNVQIVSKVTVNEDPQLIKIRQLTGEVKRLQDLVKGEDHRDEEVEALKERVLFLEQQVVEKDIEMAQLRANLEAAETAPASLLSRSRTADAEPGSSPSATVENLRVCLKKEEYLVSSLRKELKVYKESKKQILEELEENRKTKKAQIQRAVAEEREKMEADIAALKAKIRQADSTISEQEIDLRRLRRHENERNNEDLNVKMSAAIMRVKRDSERASVSLNGITINVLRSLHLLSDDATTIDTSELALAVNSLAVALDTARTTNEGLRRAENLRDDPQSCEESWCPPLNTADLHRLGVIPPRQRQAHIIAQTRMMVTPRMNSARGAHNLASPRDISQQGNVLRGAPAPPEPKPRPKSSRADTASSPERVDPEKRGRLSTRRRAAGSPAFQDRNPQRERQAPRSQAVSDGLEYLKTIDKLQEDLQRAREQLAEERAKSSHNGEEKKRLLLRAACSDSSQEDCSSVNILQGKLNKAQQQIEVLQRILQARDRIYQEVNKIGVNPACFTDAIRKIESAARSQWEEEEDLRRRIIVSQLELHRHYYPMVHKLQAEKALLSQSLINETNRNKQLCKDLDLAHEEKEALMAANETVLKKVHYTKSQLRKETEKSQNTSTVIATLTSELKRVQEENQQLREAVVDEQHYTDGLRAEVTSIEEDLAHRVDEVKQLKDQLREMQKKETEEISNTNAQFEELRSTHAAENEAHEVELKAARADADRALESLNLQVSQNQLLQEEMQQLQHTVLRQQGELSQLSGELEQQLATEETLKSALADREAAVEALKRALKEKTLSCISLQQEKDILIQERASTQEELAGVQTARSEWELEKNRLESQLKAISGKLEKGEANLLRVIAEKETELELLREAQERALEQCATLEGEKTSNEEALRQKSEILEGQKRALLHMKEDMENTIAQLREEILVKEAEIQEFEELKFMQAHLDRLEEQHSRSSAGSVAQSFTDKFSSLIQGKLFRRYQSDMQSETSANKSLSYSNEEELLSSNNASFTARGQEPSIHKMLAAKVECGTGFRKGTVPQRARRTPSAGGRKLPMTPRRSTQASAAAGGSLAPRRVNMPLGSEKRSLSRRQASVPASARGKFTRAAQSSIWEEILFIYFAPLASHYLQESRKGKTFLSDPPPFCIPPEYISTNRMHSKSNLKNKWLKSKSWAEYCSFDQSAL
eukprot:gene4079-2927_t